MIAAVATLGLAPLIAHSPGAESRAQAAITVLAPGYGLPAGWASLARGRTREQVLAAARQLVSRAVPPPGAVAVGSEPRGDERLLREGPFPGALRYVLVTHYWTIRSSYATVAAFVTHHPPASLSWNISGDTGGPRTPKNMYVAALRVIPPEIGAANARTLSVSVVVLHDGRVGIAATAFVAQPAPRPAGERVPSDAHVLDIRIYPDAHPAATTFSRRVTDPRQVAEIASMIDGLPTDQSVINCPATESSLQVHSSSISFTFRAIANGAALARADVTASATLPPTGCDPMTMTVLGRSQPDLIGGPAIIAGAGKIIATNLSKPQPNYG